jgi:hypothetical protein
MGMVFKNIEYINGGGGVENLSGTSVPKSTGRGPPGPQRTGHFRNRELRTADCPTNCEK